MKFNMGFGELLVLPLLAAASHASSVEYEYECVSEGGEDRGALLGIRLSPVRARLDFSPGCMGRRSPGAQVARGDAGYAAYEAFGACASADGTALLTVDLEMTSGAERGRARLMSRGAREFTTDYACALQR